MDGAPALISVLYRDEHFLAVSKPSGMLVHRSREAPDRDVLLRHVRQIAGSYVYPIHRIDRPTSGVVLFAMTRQGAAAGSEALHHESSLKEYLLLARGDTPDTFASDRALTGDDGSPKEARTEFVTLERFGRVSLVKARILTGRRHQIRRHLNHLGAHVVGDTQHGKGWLNREFREKYGLHRLFLHAHRLRVEVGACGSRIDVTDPLPEDLSRVLEALSADRPTDCGSGPRGQRGLGADAFDGESSS